MSASFKSKSAPIRFWIPCRSACQFLQRSLGLRKMCLMNLGRTGEMVARGLPSTIACGMSMQWVIRRPILIYDAQSRPGTRH